MIEGGEESLEWILETFSVSFLVRDFSPDKLKDTVAQMN